MAVSLGIIVIVAIIIAFVIASLSTSHKGEHIMENTAKNFALQLGSLVSLYISITALIMLIFNIITIQYPDPAAGYYEYDSAAGGIRFGIALLIVFFPAYVVLTRIVNTIRRKEHGVYLTLTKWLIYLSLLIGGAVLLGDLVAVINSFLNGEITIRFVLKALTFFVVVGGAFLYYLFDVRGYWEKHERASIQYALGAAVIVVAALVVGFTRIEAPATVHEMQVDSQQINDLMNIQSRVVEYYVVNDSLPISLDEVFAGLEAPTAPEGRSPYLYETTGDASFSLCAEFSAPTSKTDMSYARPIMTPEAVIKNPDNWDHGAGEWCFERFLTGDNTPVKLPQ